MFTTVFFKLASYATFMVTDKLKIIQNKNIIFVKYKITLVFCLSHSSIFGDCGQNLLGPKTIYKVFLKH